MFHRLGSGYQWGSAFRYHYDRLFRGDNLSLKEGFEDLATFAEVPHIRESSLPGAGGSEAAEHGVSIVELSDVAAVIRKEIIEALAGQPRGVRALSALAGAPRWTASLPGRSRTSTPSPPR